MHGWHKAQRIIKNAKVIVDIMKSFLTEKKAYGIIPSDFFKEERVMQNIWLAIIMILAVIIVLHDNVCLRNATLER